MLTTRRSGRKTPPPVVASAAVLAPGSVATTPAAPRVTLNLPVAPLTLADRRYPSIDEVFVEFARCRSSLPPEAQCIIRLVGFETLASSKMLAIFTSVHQPAGK